MDIKIYLVALNIEYNTDIIAHWIIYLLHISLLDTRMSRDIYRFRYIKSTFYVALLPEESWSLCNECAGNTTSYLYFIKLAHLVFLGSGYFTGVWLRFVTLILRVRAAINADFRVLFYTQQGAEIRHWADVARTD